MDPTVASRLLSHRSSEASGSFLQAVRRERNFALIGDDIGIGKVTQLSDIILICEDSSGLSSFYGLQR
jgi:hypothetical protein